MDHSTIPRGRLARSRRRRLLAASVALVTAVVLLAAQIVLPRIATDRLRARLSVHGHVLAVVVSAFPAVELLWGQAGSVTVRLSSYGDRPAATSGAAVNGRPRSAQTRLADFLASADHTDALDARAARFQSGRLVLEDAILTKHGPQLSATALLTVASLRSALPLPFTLRPLPSSEGGLVFQVSVDLAGLRLASTARLLARDGAVVVQPEVAGLFANALSLTVFHDSRVVVESVRAQPVIGGWQVSASARLAGG